MPLNGTLDVSPAAVTPESARTRSMSRVQNTRRAASFGYRVAGSASCAVRTLSAENPGFTSWSRAKLLISRPAPTSSMSASAVSAITSVARVTPVLFPAEPRAVSSFSNEFAFPRITAIAGTSPKTRPVTSASVMVKASTVGLSDASAMPGI